VVVVIRPDLKRKIGRDDFAVEAVFPGPCAGGRGEAGVKKARKIVKAEIREKM